MAGYALIIPEVLVLLAAGWAMFADFLPGGDRGSAWCGAGMGVAAAAAAALAPASGQLFGGALVFDAIARFGRAGAAALLAVWLVWTAVAGVGRLREAVALAAFAAMGAMLMASARDIVTLVMAVELSTLPSYVLIGYRRHRIEGLEGALKYFLLSMLTTLVMLYGLSFVYGLSGTTRYGAIDLSASGSLGVFAVVLVLIGMLAKLSAAPFHYWAPDAYEGAEPWTVAFVSTVPKLAGAIAIVELVAVLAPGVPAIGPLLAIAAGASMVLGNLAALTQTDVRRMMAYSGVAHAGYLLLGAATATAAGTAAATFYALAYAVPSLGVMLVAGETGPLVADFAGLSKRNPVVAWSSVVMLASLIGIPPMMGFFGKFYVFATAAGHGLVWWVVLAVAMSVVSAGYYLRVVHAMFFLEGGSALSAERNRGTTLVAIAVAGITLGLGIAAGPILAALGSVLP